VDPLTIIVGGAALLVGAVIGVVTTKAPSKVRKENAKLRDDLARHERTSVYDKRRISNLEQDYKSVQASRDKYRAIASTHEVKYPEPPTPIQLRKVWKERGYRGLPEANLKTLAVDLQQYEGQELHLTLTVRGRGGWKKIIGERWHVTKRVNGYNRQVPADYIGEIRFRGSVSQVVEEIGVFLRDDDTGLVVKSGVKAGKWRDHDSALKFEVDLSVKGAVKPPPMPEVHTVEVAVVEERVVERIVEKPVILSVPEGREAELCGHTKEEIVSLIDAVLDVRQQTKGLPNLSAQIVEASKAHEEASA
jgi:hypothetical protein